MSLDEIATASGRFCVLAIDHRDSLRGFLAPEDPSRIGAEQLVALKIEMVRALAPVASGVMLEPEFSIPQVLDAGAMPSGVGFIAALEAQGYLADPEAAPTRILEGWSVEAAAASGASAAKLLLPYRPDSRVADAQEAVASDVLAECRRVGLPLVLEPLFFGLDDPRDRPAVVHETVARFAAIGPDLMKTPFPVDVGVEADEAVWHRECLRISELCEMPWALLSGGGEYEVFRDQLRVALGAGCSGFMVGRALWGEAARAGPEDRATVLAELVVPRMRELVELTRAS